MNRKFNLIPDIECNLDQENVDLMGTLPYVDVLEKIVCENIENSVSLTIGLFGGWGSGKSSIIKTLSERLKKKSSNNAIKIVIYDAWKYSGDAFRRSFILELKNQLELDWEDDLRVFYRDTHEDVSTRIDINRNWLVYVLCCIPLFGLLILASSIDQVVKNYVSFLSIVVTVTLFLIQKTFTQYKIAVTTPKIFSPEQFKEVFDQAISEATGEEISWLERWWKRTVNRQYDCKRVVIVIDNVDRCDRDAAKELLLNIKTYLEHKKCVVIMPVDDAAIKSHLQYIGDEEAEEFLRKIFNVSIRIKGLNNIDRYEFTVNLIKKYSLGFSNEVASVISQEFAKNPRRIIQFLNSLSLEKEIAKEQEIKGRIPEGSVTKNIDFLAKILLIKEEYPFLYDAVLFDGLNLSKWEELYKDDKKDDKRIKEKRELQMFFGRTSGLVTPDNIMPFLLLHSKDNLMPTELMSLMQAGQSQGVMLKIKEASIDFNAFLNYLNESLDRKLIIRGVSANSELRFLLWCFAQDEMNKTLEERRASFFRYFRYIKQEHINSFPAPDLVNVSKYLKQYGHDGLYNILISYINSDSDKEMDVFLNFIKIFNSAEDLKKVKDQVNKILTNDVSQFEIVLPFLKDKEIPADYIRPDTIGKHVSTLSAKRTESDVKVCRAVNACVSLNMLPDEIHNTFLQNVFNFLRNEQSISCYKFWFENIKGSLKTNAAGLQLLQWLKQMFNSPIFPNRTDVQWKDILRVAIPLFEEYFILGEISAWECISKVYILEEDVSIYANNSLKEIAKMTDVSKWNFIDDVIRKTTQMNISEEFFTLLGNILEKGKGQDFISNKPALLHNWLNFLVDKKDISEKEKQILQMYCKEQIFSDVCKQNLVLAKNLFSKAKNLSITEVIDTMAEIILKDPTANDIRYLVDQKYEKRAAIKEAIKSGIDKSSNNEEWINLVIDTDSLWTKKEYKDLLEDRMLHLATGNDEQKEKLKGFWNKVNKDKISQQSKETIEKRILDNGVEVSEK